MIAGRRQFLRSPVAPVYYNPVGAARSGIVGASVGDAIPDSVVWQTPFDEGSGTTAADIIGNADGTITGATWQSDAGAVGDNYLSFDGADDDVDYGTPSVLDLAPGGTWTIEIPVKHAVESVTETFFSKAPSLTADRQYELRIVSGDYGVGVGGSFETSTTAVSGNWEIVYVRNNSGTVDMLVDTTEIITELSAGTGTTFTNVFAGQLGNNDGHWSGDIDSPVVHDTFLSDSEISDRVSSYPNWI